MPEFAPRKKRSAPASSGRANIVVHARQCSICRHPQRADIERAFLDWISPREISREYGISSHTTVYRHAHALGLFDRRQRALRFALGRLIERVGEVRPTAASIVSAIRLMAKLNEEDTQAKEDRSADSRDLPEASAAQESENRSSRDAALAPGTATESPSDVANAKPELPRSPGETKPPDPANDSHGPPIVFAPNAAPRRKFLWR